MFIHPGATIILIDQVFYNNIMIYTVRALSKTKHSLQPTALDKLLLIVVYLSYTMLLRRIFFQILPGVEDEWLL